MELSSSSLFWPVLMLLVLALIFGAVLGFAALRFQVESNPLVDEINALLPQTQCGQCGHPGCKPYAESIAAGGPINKCPPGGSKTIDALASLLNVEAAPLDAEHGVESVRKVAYIREAECIGCTKCIQACPVDAILGSAKHMHTVIVSECTGCDLCVEPCPVDCIDMIPVQTPLQRWHWQKPSAATHTIERPNLALIATDAGMH
jgi:Na+-translocating ferredoxin:NAD+ oxidoreductase subunit B